MLGSVLRRRPTRAVVYAVVLALVVTGLRLDGTPPPATAQEGCLVVTDPQTGFQLDSPQGCAGRSEPELIGPAGSAGTTPAQREALVRLGETALQQTTAYHGLDPAVSRRQLLTWARPEVRGRLLALIVDAAVRPPAERTPDEVLALEWVSQQQQARNVEAADAGLAEYRRFYGASAFTGELPRDVCSYKPPSPFEGEYRPQEWIGCQPNGRPGPFDLGPRIPSQEEFTRWGIAAVAGRTPGDLVELSQAAQAAISAAGSAAAVGATTAGLVAINSAVTTTLVSGAKSVTVGLIAGKLTPFAYLVKGAPGLAAGTVVGVAAIAVVATTLLVMTTVQVVNASQVGVKLQEGAATARRVRPDARPVLTTTEGLTSVLLDLERAEPQTYGLELPPAAPARRAGDPVLQVTTATGQPVARTDRLRLLSLRGDVFTDLERQLVGGLLVDPTGADEPRLSVPVQLWDPAPVVPPGSDVASERAGFDFPAAARVVRVGGRTTWSLTAIGRDGFPKPAQGCDDYHEDGCWLTDRLPFLESRPGTTLALQRYARLAGNQAPAAPGVSAARPDGTGVFFEGDAVLLRTGALSDPDGDPLSVGWELTACPDLICASLPPGAASAFTPQLPGRYRVRATVSDPFAGTAVSRELTVDVNDLPARLVSSDTGPARIAQGERWPLSLVFDRGPFREPVSVDWGDGTRGTSTVFSIDPTRALFQGDHAWVRPGTYDVVASASTARFFGRVEVVDVAPALAVDQPSGALAVEPGSTVQVSGRVTDPGTGDAVSLELTWADGHVERLALPPGPVVRAWSSSRVLRTATGELLPTDLVTARVLNGDGARDPRVAPASLRGTVVDRPPALTASVQPAPALQETWVSGSLADPNGGPVHLTVDWGDGSAPEASVRPAGSGALALAHRYALPGRYAVALRAVDGVTPAGPLDLRPVTERRLVVDVPVAPAGLGEVDFFRGDVGLREDSVSALGIAFQGGAPGQVVVDWGDGAQSVQDVDGTPQPLQASRQLRGGTYDVTVSYRVGGVVLSERVLPDVVVQEQSPGVQTLRLPQGTQPEAVPVEFLTRVSDGDAEDLFDVVVDYGDGSPLDVRRGLRGENELRLTHRYPGDGVYVVSVTAVSSDGLLSGRPEQAYLYLGEDAPSAAGLVLGEAREGEPVQLSGLVADGLGDAGAVTVDWGDGTVEEVAYGEDLRVDATHAYDDDGTYAVALRPASDDGLVGASSALTAVVQRVAPALTATLPEAVDEARATVLRVDVVDPGADGGAVTVAWGDGTPDTRVPYGPGQRVLEVGHAFPDDDPSATPQDALRVTVTAVDEDGLAASAATASTVVRDLAPQLRLAGLVDALGRPVTADRPAAAGGAVALGLVGSDPSARDALSAVVRWGDGTSTAVDDATGERRAFHAYAAPGTRTAQVELRDDDGLTAVGELAVPVVAPQDVLRRIDAALAQSRARPGLQKAERDALDRARRLVAGPGGAVADLDRGDRAAALADLVTATQPREVSRIATRFPELQGALEDASLVARAVAQTAVDAASASAGALAGARAGLLRSDALLAAGDLPGALRAAEAAVRALR